jgi:hypothetical protein
LHPDRPRGQSSNVTAAPFCENVTPADEGATSAMPSGSIRFTCPTCFRLGPSKILVPAAITRR